MKKNLLYALYGALALGALTVTSCGKGDDENKDNTVYNEFVVAGETYTTEDGTMVYYGVLYGNENLDNIDINLYTDDDTELYFEMAVPKGIKRLPKGTYTMTDEDPEDAEAFTFSPNSGVRDDGQEIFDIVDGEMTVSFSGSGDNAVYTIEVNCTLEGGETVVGIYRGKLRYADYTFEGEGSGEFDVNGETFQAAGGHMDWYGDLYNDRTTSIVLSIHDGDRRGIIVNMLVPAANDRLVAHTYSYSNANEEDAVAYTFGSWDDYSFVYDDRNYPDNPRFDIIDGTIEVSVSGTGQAAVYTITFDCTLENGETVEGTYTGTLSYSI